VADCIDNSVNSSAYVTAEDQYEGLHKVWASDSIVFEDSYLLVCYTVLSGK
jgi:hypothetical protein